MRICSSSAVLLASTGMGGMAKNTPLNQKHVAVFSCLLSWCQSLGQKGLNRAREQYVGFACMLWAFLVTVIKNESALGMSLRCVFCSVHVSMYVVCIYLLVVYSSTPLQHYFMQLLQHKAENIWVQCKSTAQPSHAEFWATE